MGMTSRNCATSLCFLRFSLLPFVDRRACRPRRRHPRSTRRRGRIREKRTRTLIPIPTPPRRTRRLGKSPSPVSPFLRSFPASGCSIPRPESLAQSPFSVIRLGKFRQLLGLLKKAVNVKDLASIRLSLPATLMEPIGNLEYWQYADRPDVFAAINEPDDELDRMLAVLRWTCQCSPPTRPPNRWLTSLFLFSLVTKDLKFVKHKIAKPFNSVLGEHFRCHWEVIPSTLDAQGLPLVHQHHDHNPSPDVLAAAGRPANHGKDGKAPSATPSSTSLLPPSAEIDPSLPTDSAVTSAATSPGTSINSGAGAGTRVVFLNEQTSHHPPISFFQIEARGPKGTVIAIGADQLSAKVGHPLSTSVAMAILMDFGLPFSLPGRVRPSPFRSRSLTTDNLL